MIQLNDAISQAFPQGNEWAAQALAALSDDLSPDALVHAVDEGWMRRGSGPDAELVDTLYILADDRLGLGRTDERPGERRWIPLVDIVAVDAVDDSPLPLQTIEIELRDGTVLCVGWPDSFSERLIPVLIAVAERRDAGPAPAAPAPPPAAPAPTGPTAAIDFLNAPPPAATAAAAPLAPPVPSAPPAPPVAAAPPTPSSPPMAFAPLEDSPPTADRSEADQAWTSFDPRQDSGPVSPDAFGPADAPAAETFDPAALGEWMAEPEPAPVVAREQTAFGGTPPWQQPGLLWPDPLRGVLYLGGHPGHSRKRKNGTMIFSPAGLEVNGTGFQNWEMSMDWAYVHSLEIQGPDEIMFGDHLKIDSTSSALVVTMVDETRMFFEIRTRRPPSLRAALAPVMLLVENIRTARVANP